MTERSRTGFCSASPVLAQVPASSGQPSPADRCKAPPRGGKGGIFFAALQQKKKSTPSLTTTEGKRRCTGRDPVGDEWQVVAEFAGWRLWARDMNADGWCSIKLVLIADRDHRANLSFAWNGKRFSDGADVQWLRQHRPEALLLAEWELARWVP